MPFPRHSGVLLHPTSLPGPRGSGDLGPAAFHFVDWLAGAEQTLWQVLPLGGIGPGNSPYMSPSAFAGNELLIDLAQLQDSGWLSEAEIQPPPNFSDSRVNFPEVKTFRMDRLRRAAERFFAGTSPDAQGSYSAFCFREKNWLDDYALFMALDGRHGGNGKVWQDWPTPLAQRKTKALAEALESLSAECNFWRFCQWCFFGQWAKLKDYANGKGIEIVGDMPIFVSPHSADVWANQNLFDLDHNGHPRVIAGVPPDYFSVTGQRWGNPLYKWSAHAKENYRWWIERMRSILTLCDIVRIDHFRGFESYWEIPAHSETAVTGHWRAGPGDSLFSALREAFADATDRDGRKHAGALKIIAEDLGIITPEVTALRTRLGLPGMRILQFAFDGHSDNLYLPHSFETNTVVYTGTHDNDTTVGWWSGLAPHEQDYVRRYLGISGESIHWALIRVASASVASISIIPMQDVLGLDSHHRMNQPGIASGYWEWRFSWNQLASWHGELLADLTRLHGRIPKHHADPSKVASQH
ncbi:MAG: 4-alpha-glucanotransferase [Propionivibrio sp.]|jgi:4-alpha-glucanotransferase|nr:4-alpha-glucanotransferase [Propionivibrio sp.]MBP6710002.1 4-alpha-glucanotransferase [Propionivibrio sp.]MBP8163169.1 4-alpha-glucanotransferase [Propionivibrio sp.]